MLASFVAGSDENTWSQKLITTVQEIKRVRSSGQKSKKKYIGELETIHGYEEAHAMIRKGKFQNTYDKDGDECYIKVEEFASDVNIDTNSASV